MATKSQFVFPPDAGSANAGNVPTRTNCGRGIPRTGDIRHIGDLIPADGAPAQTGVWAPGTIGQNVVSPKLDNDRAPGMGISDHGFDGQAQPNTVGKYSGNDASGEGMDPYSGKQGQQV